MRRHRRQSLWLDGGGPCIKYDASCAERTSSVLLSCEERLRNVYLDELAQCSGAPRRRECELEANQAFREMILGCLGE